MSFKSRTVGGFIVIVLGATWVGAHPATPSCRAKTESSTLVEEIVVTQDYRPDSDSESLIFSIEQIALSELLDIPLPAAQPDEAKDDFLNIMNATQCDWRLKELRKEMKKLRKETMMDRMTYTPPSRYPARPREPVRYVIPVCLERRSPVVLPRFPKLDHWQPRDRQWSD